jgi:hypothetical protein
VSAMDHGDPGLAWEEANAANADGQAVLDAEREAAAMDGAPPDIHTWFGLSYSNYLVIPRTLLQSMPDAWQRSLTGLLEEIGEAFADVPQAQAYKVAAAEEHEVSDLTPEQLAAEGITVGDAPCDLYHDHADGVACLPLRVYTDADGRQMEPWERVLIPVPDPVPPDNRGRTRITAAKPEPEPPGGYSDEPRSDLRED